MKMLLSVLALAATAVACSDNGGSAEAELLKALQSDNAEAQQRAAEEIRRDPILLSKVPGGKEAILAVFDNPGRHQGPLAMAMGKTWGASVRKNLVGALDESGLIPTSDGEREANATNRAILTSLYEMVRDQGVKLGASEANAAALYVGAGDVQTVLSAITLLGAIGDSAGTAPLLTALAESDNNFIVKSAVIALGNIRDAKAGDELIYHLFRERTGVSFYAESSFAVFQLSDHESVMKALDNTLRGKNERVNAAQRGSKQCQDVKSDAVCWVITAKVAEVLSDIGLTEDQMTYLSKLATPKDANQQMATKIIEALGRTSSKKAIPLVKQHVKNLLTREFIGRAIARIGDREAALWLAKRGSHTSYQKDCKGMSYSPEQCTKSEGEIRRFTLENAARAGDQRVVVELEKQVKAEKRPGIRVMIERQVTKAKVYTQCKADVACYVKLLASDNELVREKAGYELAYLRDPSASAELVRTLDSSVDDTNESRFAKFWALWQVVPKTGGGVLAKMAKKDKKSQDYIRIAAEVERLVDRIKRKK
jgi:HEAT repeat protein